MTPMGRHISTDQQVGDCCRQIQYNPAIHFLDHRQDVTGCGYGVVQVTSISPYPSKTCLTPFKTNVSLNYEVTTEPL